MESNGYYKEWLHKKAGTHIVIMGAGSGQGLRAAVMLALAGWKVGVAGRNVEVLKRLKEKFPDNVEWAEIDVTHDDAPKRLAELATKIGGMDIYFHVAGIQYINPELMISQEVETLETECVGFARMLCAAYHYFRFSGRKGQIAAITSVGGTRGTGPIASYSSGKKFGQTYIEALAQLAHMQHVPVCFTDIRPGWIRTPLELDELNYPINMTMSYAVPKILRAIVDKKRVAVIDWRWNCVYAFWRRIPRYIWERMTPPICSRATPAQTVKNAQLETTNF
ncbi:MAG: SDR family NAD(P)-dependent oxidoreductase [Bacteroidales bacterium]|nr:SDR family NAD(P)-dependent oxidoreductase [Bacteroidales bacterium]